MQRSQSDNSIPPHLDKKLSTRILWSPKVHYRVHNSPPVTGSYSDPDKFSPLPLLHLFQIHFTIILPSTTRSRKSQKKLKMVTSFLLHRHQVTEMSRAEVGSRFSARILLADLRLEWRSWALRYDDLLEHETMWLAEGYQRCWEPLRLHHQGFHWRGKAPGCMTMIDDYVPNRRYSDSLWTGRSGDRIPMKARFSVPSRPARGPPSLLYGYRLFPGGRVAEAWCWPLIFGLQLYLYLPSLPA